MLYIIAAFAICFLAVLVWCLCASHEREPYEDKEQEEYIKQWETKRKMRRG